MAMKNDVGHIRNVHTDTVHANLKIHRRQKLPSISRVSAANEGKICCRHENGKTDITESGM